MPRYRVAMRVLDLLVIEVDGEDEEDAKLSALYKLANLCAMEEESTVKVVTVAEVVNG